MIERRKAAIFSYPVWAKAIRTSDRIVLVLGEVDAGLGHLEEHVLLIIVQRPRPRPQQKKRLFKVIKIIYEIKPFHIKAGLQRLNQSSQVLWPSFLVIVGNQR